MIFQLGHCALISTYIPKKQKEKVDTLEIAALVDT